MEKHYYAVPICPEVECGLPVPRERLILYGDDPENLRLITETTRHDVTDKMKKWTEEKLEELSRLQLCGFIFKKDSASCGVCRVEVHQSNGEKKCNGVGFFLKSLREKFPNIPVIDEEGMEDGEKRRRFKTLFHGHVHRFQDEYEKQNLEKMLKEAAERRKNEVSVKD
jgi:uncharacterized protein YbbK (DUF523 family)